MLALGGLVAAVCLASDQSGDDGADGGAKPGLSMRLPQQLGEWNGTPGNVSQAEREILPEDTEFTKMNFLRASAPGSFDNVHCSIVLSGKDRTSIHRPEVCLVGQGWNIDASRERTIALRNDVDLAVRCLELSRGGEDSETTRRALYFYWFVSGEATTADHLDRILLTAKTNVFDNINPRWAYVSVLTSVVDADGAERSSAMLENFVARITPQFQTAFAKADLF